MQNLTIVFLAAVSLMSFGCKKKGGGDMVGGGAPTGSGAGSAAPTPPPAPTPTPTPPPAPAPAGGAAAAGGAGCAADATKSDDGGFCFNAPATLKAKAPYDKDETSRRYDYSDGQGKSLTIVVRKVADAKEWDGAVSELMDESKKPNKKDPQSMDLPDGGKFASWAEQDGSTWATALAHKDLKVFFCRTHGKPADPTLVEACKSMRPL